MIAHKNLSFILLDSLVATLHDIADDLKGIHDMSCNRTKDAYLLGECLTVYAHAIVQNKLKAWGSFSLLYNKATDISMNKNFLCQHIRFLDPDSSFPVEMLYRLLPIENGKAKGLFSALMDALEPHNLGWDFVVASDGENLMQGSKDSVLTCMMEVMPGLFVLKCFCHNFYLVAEHASKYLSATDCPAFGADNAPVMVGKGKGHYGFM
ncbi:proteinral transcription factor ii-i repeat domain-containing protein 2 [Plakobranchus ocellatus]|uniref:Proteinral transcription factor ii-i repeat domain-containing protein 2 n=1 Tax=Plakobranchus ocellatus TaxID=259542 RepID=A0AAV4D2B2_9GAST|nr:proteinral transcription factor ii-i repeat domain-containing protein 2 [Plakobranchus ocellatus]